jgi:hypothetical protein
MNVTVFGDVAPCSLLRNWQSFQRCLLPPSSGLCCQMWLSFPEPPKIYSHGPSAWPFVECSRTAGAEKQVATG